MIMQVKQALSNPPNEGISYNNTESGARICFRYRQQLNPDMSGRAYSIAAEARGDEASPDGNREHDWTIFSTIVDGQLRIQLVYSKKQYLQPTVSAFMQHYRESIAEVIEYCINYNNNDNPN